MKPKCLVNQEFLSDKSVINNNIIITPTNNLEKDPKIHGIILSSNTNNKSKSFSISKQREQQSRKLSIKNLKPENLHKELDKIGVNLNKVSSGRENSIPL